MCSYFEISAYSCAGLFAPFSYSVVVSGCTVTVIGSSGGSSGALTCYVGVSWLMLISILRSVMIGYYSVSAVSWNSWWGSCGELFLFLSEASLSTTMILIFSIGQPLRSANINRSSSLQDSSLTRDMKVSVIGMVSQLLLVVFFSELIPINCNPTC